MNKETATMHIAMLSNIFKPISTGSTNQISGLTKELSKQGHQVFVITSQIDPKLGHEKFEDGTTVYRLKCIKLPRIKIAMNFAWLNWITTPANFQKVSKLLVDEEIQLIHVHNHMFDSLLLGVLVSKKTKIPICLTLHTVMQHNHKIYNLILRLIDRYFLRVLVSKYAKLVIAPDYNMQKYAQDSLGATNVKVIPYGVDQPLNVSSLQVSTLIKEFQLEERKVILSVGHVNHLRNRIKLVEAMAKISEIDPSILLVVIGDIADRRAFDLVEKLGIGNSVKFLGIGTAEQIACWRKIASIEAQWLDQSPEGFNSLGVASMEGMLAGNPVISVANIDTFGPGALKNYENVVAISPPETEFLDQIILDLFGSPAKLGQLGEKAQDFAEINFGWKKNVESHLQAYSDITLKKDYGFDS